MRTMLIAALALSGLGLTGLSWTPAQAQYRVHVYNPARYSNTRATMNHRAAARAVEARRYCRKHPRAPRCRARLRD